MDDVVVCLFDGAWFNGGSIIEVALKLQSGSYPLELTPPPPIHHEYLDINQLKAFYSLSQTYFPYLDKIYEASMPGMLIIFNL